MIPKKVLVAAGLAIALPLSALALAGQDARDSFGPAAGFHRGFHESALGFLRGAQLSDSQRSQVHTLLQASHKQLAPLEQQARSLHKQIEEALYSSGTVDKNQLTQLQQQATELRGQIDAARLDAAIKVRGVLTTEQLSKVASLHQQIESLHSQERQLLSAPHSADQPQ